MNAGSHAGVHRQHSTPHTNIPKHILSTRTSGAPLWRHAYSVHGQCRSVFTDNRGLSLPFSFRPGAPRSGFWPFFWDPLN